MLGNRITWSCCAFSATYLFGVLFALCVCGGCWWVFKVTQKFLLGYVLGSWKASTDIYS